MFGSLKIDGQEKGMWWDTAWGGALSAPPAQDELIQWLYDYSGDFEFLDKVDPLRLDPPINVGVPALGYNGAQQTRFVATTDNDVGDSDFEITISAIPDNLAGLQSLIGKWNTGNNRGYLFDMSAGKLELRLATSATTSTTFTSSNLLTANAVNNLKVSRVAGKVLFSINEISEESPVTGVIDVYPSTARLGLARADENAFGFFGKLSWAKITKDTSKDIDVYITDGQSNSVGWLNTLIELPDQSIRYKQKHAYSYDINGGVVTGINDLMGVPTTSYWGNELSFSDHVYKKTGRRIAVVKSGRGSQSLAAWDKDTGDQYARVLTKTQEMIAALISDGYNPTIKALFFLQGEDDASTEENANLWESRFRDFKSNFQSDLGVTIPQWIIGRIRPDIPGRAYESVVRSAQESIASDSDSVLISIDDLSIKADGIHLDGAGQYDLGIRVAEAFLSIPSNLYSNSEVIHESPLQEGSGIPYNTYGAGELASASNGTWEVYDGLICANTRNGYRSDVENTAPFIPRLSDLSGYADGNTTGTVRGSIDGDLVHNGAPSGLRFEDAYYATNAPNRFHDGVNPIDIYWPEIVAHQNGNDSSYQKSKADTVGTAGRCILEELGQMPVDWSPTPAQYTQGLKYWTVCSSFADPLVPYPINSGDGIGPDGGWYPIDGDKVYLVEDV